MIDYIASVLLLDVHATQASYKPEIIYSGVGNLAGSWIQLEPGRTIQYVLLATCLLLLQAVHEKISGFMIL